MGANLFVVSFGASWGPVVYGVYGAMALFSGLFVWRFVAETRGKELEDMTD